MKYIVMETFTSYAVLLDEEGRFVKAANPNYEVGQTVKNPVLMRDDPPAKPSKVTTFKSKKGVASVLVALAAVAFLFVFTRTVTQDPSITVASSIYLRINPEVRMDLNDDGDVVDIEGMNPDGKALVEGYEPQNRDRTTVTTELIERAIDMGFLTEGDQITFRIDATNEQFQQYGVELRSTITKYLDGRLSVTIEITNVEDAPPAGQPQDTSAPVEVDDADGDDMDDDVNDDGDDDTDIDDDSDDDDTDDDDNDDDDDDDDTDDDDDDD
ncbi:hypothetical protein [Atopococcus tabaci]|uniref:anti-sigma-I factor RsgI family protein n=1 Tax=Atopococcus tabaci TaxID=269774 RepID=UPI0003F83F20|nr:hypothetical protein [Atopococcus tabaci]